MNIGLSEPGRERVRERYAVALAEGHLLRDGFRNPTYALLNADEFFAETSQVRFCANPEIESYLHDGVNCADEFQSYDLVTFRLIRSTYRGAADLC